MFFIGCGIWLIFGEDVFGIAFKPVWINVPGMPDKVLEELVAILLAHDDASSLDDIFEVLDKFATIRTKLVLVDRGVVEDIFQRVVDLGVVG